MKLYIFEQVLTDWTDGMAVVAAESVERAIEICKDEFNSDCADWIPSHAIEVVNQAEGVVSYVYGGG